jgi:hypothetical protein
MLRNLSHAGGILVRAAGRECFVLGEEQKSMKKCDGPQTNFGPFIKALMNHWYLGFCSSHIDNCSFTSQKYQNTHSDS